MSIHGSSADADTHRATSPAVLVSSDSHVARSKSYVQGCTIATRPGDTGPLFAFDSSGVTGVWLDGYAIIPVEEYEALIDTASKAVSS